MADFYKTLLCGASEYWQSLRALCRQDAQSLVEDPPFQYWEQW